jgi:hypothetical protein
MLVVSSCAGSKVTSLTYNKPAYSSNDFNKKNAYYSIQNKMYHKKHMRILKKGLTKHK